MAESRWSWVQNNVKVPSGPFMLKMEEEIKIEKHLYVPEHIKLSEEQIEELLKHYNISKKQLPRMLKEDPAIAKLDVKKGDVIKIVRRNNDNETYFYRVVI